MRIQFRIFSFNLAQKTVKSLESPAVVDSSRNLTLNFLVAMVNSLNTKTHSSEEMTEFCFEKADVKAFAIAKRG